MVVVSKPDKKRIPLGPRDSLNSTRRFRDSNTRCLRYSLVDEIPTNSAKPKSLSLLIQRKVSTIKWKEQEKNNKILILQKRALRLLYFADWHDHAIPLFLKANMLLITFLYYESVSALMQDISNGKALANMSNFFQAENV